MEWQKLIIQSCQSNMINRLVAENTFKLPPKSIPNFAISKKLIAFQTDTCIKIRSTHRETKDIDIPITQPPLQFLLSQTHPWLLLLTPQHFLQVYSIEYISGITDGSFKKIAILHNVQQFWQNRWGLVLSSTNKTLKLISFKEIIEKTEVNLNIDINSLKALTELNQPYTIVTDVDGDRVLVIKEGGKEAEVVTEIYDRINKEGKHERYAIVSYLREVLCLYKDRYVLQKKGEKEVEIIDLEQSKIVGKFGIDMSIKHCELRQNLFVIINSKDNTDYLNFFVLNPQPSSTQPLITNRVTYEKGKGDIYKLYNLPCTEAAQYLDKKKNIDISDTPIHKIEENTSSILYILNKTKEKIQIIKLDHSKLLKSSFGEEKMDHIIYSKKQSTVDANNKREENAQIERSRIHSSIELKTAERSMEEMQKRFVESLIDIKLKKVMIKFNQLQQRVSNLQKIISGINSKIENNLEKINRKEIKQKVQQLFESLTPQFEKYFSEIFKQVSGVFQQGITYYNLKLAKEADFHKEALTQIVSQTFKFTEEVAEISKKEQSISEKTEEHLKKILDAKKKWTRYSQEFENRTKEVASPIVRLSASGGSSGAASSGAEGSKPEGKVFVRADLNYPTGKRQT